MEYLLGDARSGRYERCEVEIVLARTIGNIVKAHCLCLAHFEIMSSSTTNINMPNNTATRFLDLSREVLSAHEYTLLSQILSEWHSSPTFNQLRSGWMPFKKSASQSSLAFINILCFNVRGLDRRWGEVCILSTSHQFDVLVLGEVGRVNLSLIGASFPNYRYFHQKGENSHGRILVLIRNNIHASRVPCPLANVCVIDLHLEESIRVVALYAPASKSWKWPDLSSFTTTRCVVMGDSNVDLEKDGDKADSLLEWMDSRALGPYVPDKNTSLRSDRTIDYALAAGIDVTIQTHEGETTSDHKPLFCTLACDGKQSKEGCRTLWAVFSLCALSYVRLLGEAMELWNV
jgi:endonuclease/exonuclease/phosphatase (EEP) superfamily protein YafD